MKWLSLSLSVFVGHLLLSQLQTVKSKDLQVRNIRSHHRESVESREVHDGEEWSYEGSNGPSAWPNLFPTCGSDNQSPINVETHSLVKDTTLGSFTFRRYHTLLGNLNIRNNGHTVVVSPRSNTPSGISDGGLRTFYPFTQLHFHWGNAKNKGSDHTVDGKAYPVEMHLVHELPEGTAGDLPPFAVLAVLFKETRRDNPKFDPIIKALKQVTYKDSEGTIPGPLRLFDLLPQELDHYYRYDGSLTTPPCTEGVVWSIFPEVVPIGTRQLAALRALKSTRRDAEKQKPLVNNFRPVQPLNSRKVLEAEPEC